ncbi:MAG: radical SAM protein, partial [Chloroflexaceae bacterium]|nr:radical SAM protein [Chloroflexaceae bacterium]
MYALHTITADPQPFAQAVQQCRPFRPLSVKIKVIFGCNLRCVMCNHWRFQRGGALPMARLHQLVEELAALGCRKVHFSGGEPLLRRELPELISHAQQ